MRHRALIGYLILAAGVIGIFFYVGWRIDKLTKVQGQQLCRQVALADGLKPSKVLPRSLIERSVAGYQQSRSELGLKPCPRART